MHLGESTGYAIVLTDNGTVGRLYGQKYLGRDHNRLQKMSANKQLAVGVGALYAAQQRTALRGF
jgi:hypothetical protein